MQRTSAMKKTTVFDGNALKMSVPPIEDEGVRCFLNGTGGDGIRARVPLNDDLLSKHMLFLGGIGMGKTNGIFQIIHQLRQRMNADDVMLIFDTKGDFYNTFYQKGDIVISNDDTPGSAIIAKPAEDAELIARDLGALIMDIQQLGDLGIQKWKEK